MAIVNTIITECRYALIDTEKTQFSDTELINYLNECCDIVHQTLVDMKSELVRTGTTTITTASGTERYTLPDDLWRTHKVWADGEDPMEECEEGDRYQYVKSEEDGDTSARTTPDSYYLEGDNIGLLPYSDSIYNINIIYYPAYSELVLTDTMLYKGFFNSQIRQGIILLAKNRNELGSPVEGVLMDIYQNRALALTRSRRKKVYQMSPRWK